MESPWQEENYEGEDSMLTRLELEIEIKREKVLMTAIRMIGLEVSKNLSEEDKDMIVNEISLVIQKIFSVKQPKDQRSRSQMAQGIIQ